MIKATASLVKRLNDRGLPATMATALNVLSKAMAAGQIEAEDIIGTQNEPLEIEEEKDMSTASTERAERIFSGGSLRVKNPSESYSTKRWEAKHTKMGCPVFDEFGNQATKPSQLSMAKTGVLIRQALRRAGLHLEQSDHEKALWAEMLERDTWHGFDGPPDESRIYSNGAAKAAIIDDSTSGAIHIVPEEFDADLVSTPLLGGELFPRCDIKPCKTRRIAGASIGTPTMSWGGGDGVSGSIFDSTSLIDDIDTDVHVVSLFIEIGRDTLADSPIELGSVVTALAGERLKKELDRVVAEGAGVTEPLGIMTASGTTSVSFSSAAASVDKYLSLLFSVPKAQRDESFVLCGNETSYRRARSIQTGVTGDTRLVFGMGVEDFRVFDRPYAISVDLANTQLFAGSMKSYRVFRRLGLSVEVQTQGSTLTTANKILIAIRGRYGGRPVRPSSFGVVTDAQA